MEAFLICEPLFAREKEREREDKKPKQIKMIRSNMNMLQVCEMDEFEWHTNPKKLNKLENTFKYLSFCLSSQ